MMLRVLRVLATLASCTAIPVTFKVGFVGPVSPEGPHIAGSFQDWDPSATALASGGADGTYETTVDLPAGTHEFKFINGGTWELAEVVPSSCSETASGNANRVVTLEEAAVSAEVHVCFQECSPCSTLPKCKMYNCPTGYMLKASSLQTSGSSSASCCEPVEEGKGAVVVRSSGFSDGNWAEFWLNDELLYATGTRGLTIVELTPEATVKHTETFDTYLDSSKLEEYLASAASGNMILIGAVDEASAKLSEQAEELIAGCGAQLIDQVAFRSSYALIGQKDGLALSEVALPEGGGTAVAVGQVSLPEPVLPLCKMYNCPSGFALKADVLEAPGDSAAACCLEAGAGQAAMIVRSAGYSDGNWAEFWLNGVLLYATGTRGLTVVEMWPNMTVKHTESFDTYSDSSTFVAYLSAVTEGNMILVGAVDEASANLSPEAKSLLAACGAQLIQQLAFRSSYSLIGLKGGAALAEAVLPASGGHAVAVAIVKLPEPPAPPVLPFCDMKVSDPPMSGELAIDGNLELSGGCRFRVWESPEISQCLSGTWVIVTGSSNALLIFNTLLMLLAPDEADVQRKGRFGGSHLLDAVIEDGVIIHYETVRSSEAACVQSTAGGGADETQCRSIYASALQKAPAPNSKRVRVTMFLSFFWARTATAVDLVEADAAWANAEVAMVTQVVAWYVVCNGIKFTGCPRSNLIDMEEEAVQSMFVTEMDAVLNRMAPFCAPGGRAGRHGCVVATNSWSSPGPSLMAMFQGYNAEITKAMQSRSSSSFRYVDIFALGESMPGETYLGHGSQILHIWTWQALLGGFCPTSSATTGSQIEFEGPVCWRKDASLDRCTAYSGTVLWQCMNSMLCSHRLVDKPTTTSTESSAVTTTITSTSDMLFAPVDGGIDRACRGATPSDNNANYFEVVSGIESVDACKDECARVEACIGIEHSGSRCEVWTRVGGIQASIALAGFTCLSYGPRATTTTTSTSTRNLSALFAPVDGGVDRACRGGSPSDNSPGNYVVVPGVPELADCQAECMKAAGCVGIEFSNGRCEVWVRADGIEASIALSGFTCQRLVGDARRMLALEVFP